MVEYQDQTSGAIRLYLAKNNFEMGQFTLLEDMKLSHGELELEFGILGESHFVIFKQGSEKLYEICACVEAKIADNTELLAHDFLPNLHAFPVATNFAGLCYTFSFSYDDWIHGLLRLERLRAKAQDPDTHFIKHLFPPHDTIKEDAITEVYASLGDTVNIFSVHTYPNEHMMVFTESVLEKSS